MDASVFWASNMFMIVPNEATRSPRSHLDAIFIKIIKNLIMVRKI